MSNIIENATITYKNGTKQLYDAILIADTGIYFGLINRQNTDHTNFEDHGFIPFAQLQKITICTDDGSIKDIDF